MIIRVIDFETTGFEPPAAQVCEWGICDIDADTLEIGPWRSRLCGVDAMPPEVRAVHHIALSDCAGLPAFNEADLYEGATVLVAHNAEFEGRFINPPISMICTYKAALRVWPDAPSHSNGALRYWLEDQGKIAPDHSLTMPAHRAGPDAYVTAHLIAALMREGHTCREMAAWTKEPKLLQTCQIGKFRGKKWADVEEGFLGWMIKTPDMDQDLKWNAARELKRRREEAIQ